MDDSTDQKSVLNRASEEWKLKESLNRDAEWILSGPQVLAPLRYYLIAGLLFSISVVKPQPLTPCLAIALTLWACRRFSLIISSEQGVILTLTSLIPYRSIKLPLLQTQLKLNSIASTGLFHKKIDRKPHDLMYVALVHPQLYKRQIILMTTSRATGERLTLLFSHLLNLAHNERSIVSKSPLSLYHSEPGEWGVTLIELFPKLFGPRVNSHLLGSELYWWSPTALTLALSPMLFGLGLYLILFQPWLSIVFILLSICVVIFSRDNLLVRHDGIEWTSHFLGLPLKSRSLSSQLVLELECDLHAPNGRRVCLIDQVTKKVLRLGRPWDSAWIHRELSLAMARHARNHFGRYRNT